MANDKRKRMISKADALVSEILHLMYRSTCCKCGRVGTKEQGFHPHHIIRKGHGGANIKTRFRIFNLVLACDNCHTLNEDSFHRITRMAEYDWLEANMPMVYQFVTDEADRSILNTNLDFYIEDQIEQLKVLKANALEAWRLGE